MNLKSRIGGIFGLGVDLSSAKIGSCQPEPVIGTTEVRPTESTPGIAAILSHDRLLHPDDRLRLLHLRLRNARAQRQHVLPVA